jgi:hypothetical protein
MKALKDKDHLTPMSYSETKVEKVLSSFVFLGKQENSNDNKNVSIPIWIGANAS